jgi:hypothetical protein
VPSATDAKVPERGIFVLREEAVCYTGDKHVTPAHPIAADSEHNLFSRESAARVALNDKEPFMLPRQQFKKFAKDRVSLVLAAALVLATIVVTILLILWLQPSDVQIPIRYNGFSLDLTGRTGTLFNDQWYERISFIVFGLLQAGASLWLAVKMHESYKVMANFLIAGSLLLLVVLALIGFFINRTITL